MTDKHEHLNEDEFITLVDPEGNEELYQILLTFDYIDLNLIDILNLG